jgi:antitoxin MazE
MEQQIRKRDIQLVPIGNSKGIRISKELLLRKKYDNKLSWEDTYKAMAYEKENWDDFDTTIRDGLEDEYIKLKKLRNICCRFKSHHRQRA